MSINRVVVTGRLTADPELKVTPANVPVLTISIAVDRKFKNADGLYDVDYFDVVFWRNTADFVAKHFHKGDKIEVDGKIHTRKWKDKYEQNRVNYEIVADNVDFGGKKQNNVEPEYDATPVQVSDFKIADDDELPFF